MTLRSKLFRAVIAGTMCTTLLPVLALGQTSVSGAHMEKTSLALARVPFLNSASLAADDGALGETALAAVASPMVEPIVTPVVKDKEITVSPRTVRVWQALTVSQHSAAVFDAWSTRKALTSGNGYERNPLLRPFAQSATIYPATQAVPFALDFLSYRMLRSKHPLLRRTWWLPQAISIAGSTWCGSRNLHVANLQR
jgi:hypothetical protein